MSFKRPPLTKEEKKSQTLIQNIWDRNVPLIVKGFESCLIANSDSLTEFLVQLLGFVPSSWRQHLHKTTHTVDSIIQKKFPKKVPGKENPEKSEKSETLQTLEKLE